MSERMRSRIERMPAIPLPSTTTMCWKPPLVIASAAWLKDQSGAEKVLRGARWSATRSVSESCPAATEWRTSRALIIPGGRPSFSGSTIAAPIPRSPIFRAASRSVSSKPTAKTSSIVIASRIWVPRPSSCPSFDQRPTMSRIETMPKVSSPSNTMRCRKPSEVITFAACWSDESGGMVIASGVKRSATCKYSGLLPDATQLSTSRSAMIPGRRDLRVSGSTIAAPMFRSDIRRAASGIASSGLTVRMSVLITSRMLTAFCIGINSSFSPRITTRLSATYWRCSVQLLAPASVRQSPLLPFRQDQAVEQVVGGEHELLDGPDLLELVEPEDGDYTELEHQRGKETITYTGPNAAAAHQTGKHGEGRTAARAVEPVGELDERPLTLGYEEGKAGHAYEQAWGALLDDRVGRCLLDKSKSRGHLAHPGHRHRGDGP